MELETWVNSIHSACAAAFARHRGKTGTLHLLQEEIYRLEKGIESVSFYWPFENIICKPSVKIHYGRMVLNLINVMLLSISGSKIKAHGRATAVCRK